MGILFRKLKKELTDGIEAVAVQRGAWKASSEEADKRNKEAKRLIDENKKEREELRSIITGNKIKDVLRTLDFNKHKPDRIIVGPQEHGILKNHRDVVKAGNGLDIYGVRIILDSRRKGPFVITVVKRNVRKK